MQRFMLSLIWIVCLVVFIPFFLGCTMTQSLYVKPSLKSLPQPDKLPLKAGIYYGPEFMAFEHIRIEKSPGVTHRFVAPIGAMSIELFDKLFPLVFNDVVRVYDLPPYPVNSDNVDVVIEPVIKHFDFRLGMGSVTEAHSLIYRFILYTPDGTPASAWSVIGKGNLKWGHTTWQHIKLNLNDAAENFLNQFREASGIESVYALDRNQLLSPIPCVLTEDKIFIKASSQDITIEQKDNKLISLKELGIISIQIRITNNGTHPVSLNPITVRIKVNNQTAITPVAVSEINPKAEIDYGELLVGPLATIGGQIERDKKRLQLQKRFGRLELKPVTLQKGQKAEGLVYFKPAEETPDFEEAELSIWLLDKNQKGLHVTQTLGGIGFKGKKKKK